MSLKNIKACVADKGLLCQFQECRPQSFAKSRIVQENKSPADCHVSGAYCAKWPTATVVQEFFENTIYAELSSLVYQS